MKKIIKSKIFLVFITSIICISGTVTATTLYFANQVSYTPSDDSTITNVQDALNNLYSVKTELNNLRSLGDATSADILEGKLAVVKGELVTGSYDSSEHALADGTYYITVGVTAAYRNVSQYGLAQSRSVNYVVKLVVKDGTPTVSWHSAPYTGSEDLWITAGGVRISS